jgi:hypothetical protein
VFNGSRFRAEIAPRIADFQRTLDEEAEGKPIRRAGQSKASPNPTLRAVS